MTEDMDKNAFNVAMGKRLCELRNLHGISQKDIGARLGVTYQQVHKYETGETQIPPVHLFTYARLFKVNMAYLYGFSNESNDDMPELDKRGLSRSI
jgi:transcriptional regulator with XRE-family HTH domain